jgi:hypothetical protein
VNASDILSRARSLILDGWCQGADARDAVGREVLPWSREAQAWSVLGALVGGDGVGRSQIGVIPILELGEAIVALGEAGDTHSLQAWNDQAGRTQDEVLALFDRALAVVAAEAHVAHIRPVS